MKVKTFVCNMLHENCYLVYDEVSREAAVIDPGFYWDEEKKKFAKRWRAFTIRSKKRAIIPSTRSWVTS
jgi:hypothetical protein